MNQEASKFIYSFECLLDAYQQIGEQLPFIHEYGSMFNNTPLMIQTLGLIYVNLLEFHQWAIRIFSRKCKSSLMRRARAIILTTDYTVWKQRFHPLWTKFGTETDRIVRSLRAYRDQIETQAGLSRIQRFEEELGDAKSKLGGQASHEQLIYEASLLQHQPPAWKWDHEGYCAVRKEFPSTCRWILKHEYLVDWLSASTPMTPILWINGIPGAGRLPVSSKRLRFNSRSTR